MHTKQKQLGRRLERRYAFKNVDYDASTSSSSSSYSSASLFDVQFVHPTQSLDTSLLCDRINYRIDGNEGEVDLICRSLGLSGPEDFAIPAADWEAHKACSVTCSNYLTSSRFRCFTPDSTEVSPGSDILESFESSARVNDGGIKRDTGSLRFAKPEEFRILTSKCDDDDSGIGTSEIKPVKEPSEYVNGVYLVNAERSKVLLDNDDNDTCKAGERGYVEGKGRIKGLRPPLLARPPAMSRVIVDNPGSTWDLIRGFAPVNSSLTEDADNLVGPTVIDDREPSENMALTTSQIILESSDDNKNDGSLAAATDLEYFISPGGSVRCNIKNWQKGDFLGSGSFGTVYEGFNE